MNDWLKTFFSGLGTQIIGLVCGDKGRLSNGGDNIKITQEQEAGDDSVQNQIGYQKTYDIENDESFRELDKSNLIQNKKVGENASQIQIKGRNEFSQIQEAGENSMQISAINSRIIINERSDEKGIRDLIDDRLDERLSEYPEKAKRIYKDRIDTFENVLIPKMIWDSILDALQDPSFLISIYDAQMSAASSERVEDYELLSDLLIHRGKNPNNRHVRSSISRAIRIVGEISDDALLGLTIFYSVTGFLPNSGIISEALDDLDLMYKKLINGSLPQNTEWIDHLDVLDCARVNKFGVLNPIRFLYSNRGPITGYFDVGIEKTSAQYSEAVNILEENDLPGSILIEHELRPGYVRLPIRNESDIESSCFLAHPRGVSGTNIMHDDGISLTNSQKEAVKKVYSLYSKDNELFYQNITAFMEKWDQHKYLKEVREWWDAIPFAFSLTQVGDVLACTNARRFDPNLPYPDALTDH